MDAWMGEFHNYLAYENAALAAAEGSDADKAGSVDRVKAAICDNVNLYIEKNEEEFQRFLQTFVQDVWTLLTKTKNPDQKCRRGAAALLISDTVPFNSVHHSHNAGGRQVVLVHRQTQPSLREDDEESRARVERSPDLGAATRTREECKARAVVRGFAVPETGGDGAGGTSPAVGAVRRRPGNAKRKTRLSSVASLTSGAVRV